MSWLKSGTARGPPVLPGHSPPGHGVSWVSISGEAPHGSRYLGRLPMCPPRHACPLGTPLPRCCGNSETIVPL